MLKVTILFMILTSWTIKTLGKECTNSETCYVEAAIKSVLTNPFLQEIDEDEIIYTRSLKIASVETRDVRNETDDTKNGTDSKKSLYPNKDVNCLQTLFNLLGQNSSIEGKRGPRGHPGKPGPRGPMGPQGFTSTLPSKPNSERIDKNVTQIIIGNNEATSCIMPEIIIGIKGEQGKKGEMGIPGYPGDDGVTGQKGENGFKGEIGDTGRHGELGNVGKRGPPGPDGHSKKGVRGNKAYSPILYGEIGKPGETGLKGETGELKSYVILIPAVQNNTSRQHTAGELKILQKPTRNGTKSSPGRTCADIMEDYPNLGDGRYYIDPNGDGINDAVEVSCDMWSGATCIQAIQNRTQHIIGWLLNIQEDYAWLSEIPENGIKIKYEAGNSQIKYLQMLSPLAEQSIELRCINYNADESTRKYDEALKLLGWNDAMITQNQSSKNLRYQILSDEYITVVNEGIESLTKLRYKTNISNRLPIADIAVRIRGVQSCSIQIGPVCFLRYKKNEITSFECSGT